VLSDRAMSKLVSGDRGHEYVRRQLVEAGAPEPAGSGQEAIRAWAKAWVPKLTVKSRHKGNHRYAFPLAPGVLTKRAERERRPYPKADLFGRSQ
jgi:hypothetical protein